MNFYYLGVILARPRTGNERFLLAEMTNDVREYTAVQTFFARSETNLIGYNKNK